MRTFAVLSLSGMRMPVAGGRAHARSAGRTRPTRPAS